MPEISSAVREMRLSWMRPDGEPIMDAIELWRHMLEIACGFYYRWNPTPPPEWRAARKTYAKAVRAVLKHNQRGLDSESQVRRAIIEGHYPEHVSALQQWQQVAPTFKPNTEAVWVSDRMLKRCAEWMESERGIVWVQHVEFGKDLARLTGTAFYQRGGVNQWGKPIEDQPPGTPMILSLASNSEGRNLQAWNSNLFTYFPTSGAQAEQCLGRTHREGQQADEVNVTLLVSLREQAEAFERARSDAAAITHTTGQEQKLTYADIDVIASRDAPSGLE
ncbi:MAG: SWF/SNF helicase family protein [Acidobacteria bacterium]|nr:SWF/SNF helicase family protein [Acidobacteriota bacterium]